MIETPDARTDALRDQLRGMWGSVAGAWEQHAAYVDERGAPIAERMLALTLPGPGDRVLELACGPGSVGLMAAGRVGAAGEVVLSDLAPEMTAVAAARAAALRLTNVRTEVLDAERIEQPDASYDIVLCREGLMLVPDPERAAHEIHRVLRPGGRVAVAVWGPRDRNPWLGIVLDTVSEQLGTPMPPPGIPHPFSLDDADTLAEVLASAGLSDVVVEEVSTPYDVVSAEEWWERSTALAGPLARKLAALPAPAAAALRARGAEAISAYATPTGFHIPGVSLVASARRA